MRVLTSVLFGAAFVLLPVERLPADIVTPSDVRATSQFGLGIFVDNLIDGSGLDGEGSIEDQLHDNIPEGMWFSGCGDAGLPGGTPEGGCSNAFAVAPVVEQIVEFELATPYALSTAIVWQYNELNPGAGPFPGRGVKSLEILVSPGLEDPFALIGTYELEIAAPDLEIGVFSEAAQSLVLEGAPTARRVQFRILEAHSGNPDEYVGLSEVRFDGTVVEGPLDPTVSRTLSTEYFTDSTTPLEVTLDVVLDAGTGPFDLSITEILPTGWTASDISGEGTFANGEVSWSLGVVSESDTLTYTATPADGAVDDATLEGTFSFDGGEDLPITGASTLTLADRVPTIRRQPQGGRVQVGSSFTFNVEVTGSRPLSLRWEKDGVPIDGATESTLAFEALESGDAGDYSVVASNDFDFAVSDVATLTVTRPNVARCGTATQSTTALGGDAANAIDGNTSGSAASASQTADGDPLPWFELRLSRDAEIETIVLWNRTELPERLSNFTVFVLDAAREEVWSDEFFPEGAFPAFPDPADGAFVIDGVGVEGRIIRIEKGEDVSVTGSGRFLALAEVEVSGSEPCVDAPEPVCPVEGEGGYADTHCDGLTVESPDGGGIGDYLIRANASDDSGDPVQYAFFAVHRQFGTTLIRGTFEVEWAFLPLTFGTWDVSVFVDDHAQCADEAADAFCSTVIEVTDPTCAGGELCNVAIRGFATQSSTFLFGPGLAIDGDTDGDIGHNSLTHTGFDDASPTWEVELDRDYEIETIVLWNRTDCCSERLTNFTVSILDEKRQEVRRDEFFTDGNEFPDTTAEGFEIPTEGDEGRIVQVQLQDTHPGFDPGQLFLSLAEVQVFAVVPEDSLVFKRGDANSDDRADLSDGIFLLNHLFLGGPGSTCLKAADSNDSGVLDLTDSIYLLNHLFIGGPPPPPPFSECGTDGSDDDLGCDSFPPCE